MIDDEWFNSSNESRTSTTNGLRNHDNLRFEEQPNEPFKDSSKERFEGRLVLKAKRHG